MRLTRFFCITLLAVAGMVFHAQAQVTLSTDFTNSADQRTPLYKFWEVRNEIPLYPRVGAQKPPNPHTSNCIRLLGGWSTNGVINLAEDSCIWDEAQQKYVYRLDKIIERIDGVLTDGFEIHQLVLDNPPWCFQRGLTFSTNPGPGEYDEANRISTYGNSMPPGEPAEWNAFIRAVMNRLVEVYGRAQVEQWRFRIHTEADFHPHHWAGTKQDYFDHYANTVNAVHAVLPEAKVAAHFLQAGVNGTYGVEFVNWCDQNNIPCDFIGISYYPFYRVNNHVDLDRVYNRDLKPFVDAPGWKPHMRLEIPEYSLFTERDDDGFNMGVGTSHNPAFVAMLAKMLYEKSIINVHNWGEKNSDPIYLALDGMLGKHRFSNQKTGSPANANNKIDGIFAVGADRTSVDALIHNYNSNPAYVATESVNLSLRVPVPSGTTYTYRIASCDQATNPHYQFVQKYPLAGMWQSEGGWILDRIKPDSPNQTDKNGLLKEILVEPGRTLWRQEEDTFLGYQSLVWSEWTTVTTSGGDALGSFLDLTVQSPSFSFQKVELRTSTPAVVENLDAPVAHWPLDQMDGEVADDISVYARHGTLLNGAEWRSDGVRPTHVYFDGDNDRISTPFQYALSSSDSFTWAWWANKQSPDGTDNNAIMVGNRYPDRTGNELAFIKLTPQRGEFANTAVGTGTGIESHDYANVTDDGWHHYAMVKSGMNLQWYKNGVAQGDPVEVVYNETSPIPFLIGGDADSNNRFGEHFEGLIDDVVLYQRALSPLDVESVMNGFYLPHERPTISAVEDQVILANTSAGPLAFTLGDDLTATGSINLTASSSNPDLVPVENIVFGGADADRTVSVTPRPNQSGSALITLVANDGSLSSANSFTLTVMPLGTIEASLVANTPGTTPWECPPGITTIQVECWGGGGAGGGARRTTANGGAGGGGGAGGAYARMRKVPVTPGVTYDIIIPAAATCSISFSDGQRFDGTAVSFTGNDGVTVTAAGGQGGASHIGNADGASGAGSSSGSLGDLFYQGGSGGNFGSNNGGSGGGGASDLANGGDGSITSTDGAGDGATGSDPEKNGGPGGAGRGAGNSGIAGGSPGGGGGGAKSQIQNGSFVGGAGGVGQIVLTYFQAPITAPNTSLEDWRLLHFGTIDDEGTAANTYDANFDGEINLLEFATGQDPKADTLARAAVTMNGEYIEYRYTRSKAAVADGMTFQMLWSDSLHNDSWSSDEVLDILDPEPSGDLELENRLATKPLEDESRLFLRLKITPSVENPF